MTEPIKFAAQSHTGLVRENNEDTYESVYPGPGYPLALILADGMGGHSKGEIASEIAADFIASFLREYLLSPHKPAELTRQLQELVKKANVKVYLSSLDEKENQGMGTTLTAAILLPDWLITAHVGDCRAYILKEGQLRQLTVDHTLVQEMVDAGSITAAETRTHPRRNVLTRALGFPEFVHPDITETPVTAGDRVILCSDGLHGFVPDDRISQLASAGETPSEVVNSLIQAALTAGGEDNVTVLCAFVPGHPGQEVQS
ncbi:MAG: Stp1/IreP family PP2C-type Ser/Thr phosphatase [Clostridia bacterium]|nr:Stp1/IreP family PP2C-type Ser/Thr phosphatase [Clostridia bacterium]